MNSLAIPLPRSRVSEVARLAAVFGEMRDRLAARTAERERAEEALRESEERYRRIVETAQEGIWIVDLQNRTAFANQKMAQMLGYTVEEMIGVPLDAFLDVRGRKGGETVLMRALEALQGERYLRLAEKRPANEAFLYGWLANRIGS